MALAWDASGLTARVQRVQAAIREVVPQRLDEAGQDVLQYAESASDFPVDTGSLRNSGQVAQSVQWQGNTVSVELSFGGDSPGYPNDPVDYAVEVHDGPNGRYTSGRPYLAAPMDSYGPGRLERAEADALRDLAALWGR